MYTYWGVGSGDGLLDPVDFSPLCLVVIIFACA